MKTSYRVDGMSCGGCAASVTRAIQAIAPDAVVEVDLHARQVTVGGLDDEAQVKQAIEDAGFDFGGPV